MTYSLEAAGLILQIRVILYKVQGQQAWSSTHRTKCKIYQIISKRLIGDSLRQVKDRLNSYLNVLLVLGFHS